MLLIKNIGIGIATLPFVIIMRLLSPVIKVRIWSWGINRIGHPLNQYEMYLNWKERDRLILERVEKENQIYKEKSRKIIEDFTKKPFVYQCFNFWELRKNIRFNHREFLKWEGKYLTECKKSYKLPSLQP